MKRYILIENIKEPILVELAEGSNGSGYIVFPKSNLDKLPQGLRIKLINNGLYKSIESAKNSFDSYFNLHRLVLCLKQNIVGFIVHHIVNNPEINNICNLLKVTEKEHTYIHGLGNEVGQAESYKKQGEQVKKSRATLAKNYELVLKILKLRGL